MRIEAPETLVEFRAKRACENCRYPTPYGAEPHHLFTRGAGRIDAPWNLISLCRLCHTKTHAQAGFNAVLLVIVAKREKTLPEAITEAKDTIRRLPKSASLEWLEAEIRSLPTAVQKLVWQAIKLRE